MKKNEIQNLTLTAVFSAIILVMIFVPQVGFITFGVASLTLIHIPVLIGVFLLPKKYSLLLGFIFGIGSLIKAAIAPTGVLDPLFVMPWISVLPRVLFALAAAYIFDGFKLLQDKLKNSDIYIFGIVSLLTVFGMYYAAVAIIDSTGWSVSVVFPITLLMITLFITAYYAFIKSNDKNRILIPSTILISTVIHTVLVLAALVIFESAFISNLLQSDNLIGFVYTIAVTNGLLEAILAVLIGTPIILALKQIKNNQ
jgi:uncharacterized membrane protein